MKDKRFENQQTANLSRVLSHGHTVREILGMMRDAASAGASGQDDTQAMVIQQQQQLQQVTALCRYMHIVLNENVNLDKMAAHCVECEVRDVFLAMIVT